MTFKHETILSLTGKCVIFVKIYYNDFNFYQIFNEKLLRLFILVRFTIY